MELEGKGAHPGRTIPTAYEVSCGAMTASGRIHSILMDRLIKFFFPEPSHIESNPTSALTGRGEYIQPSPRQNKFEKEAIRAPVQRLMRRTAPRQRTLQTVVPSSMLKRLYERSHFLFENQLLWRRTRAW